MKNIYLVMAVIGGVLPYVFFYDFVASEGLNIFAFIELLFANSPASGFTTDLLISSFVFWLYMFQLKGSKYSPNPIWFILINLSIGLSCALPAYLYKKEVNKANAN